MILCLHHSDHDGRFSGAIVKDVYPDCVTYEMNHYDPIPWALINSSYMVIMVDFSLPIDTMKHIASKTEFIWIDHHISIIKEALEHNFNPEGIRYIGKSGCYLTWKYYHGNRVIPVIVDNIAKYDVFDFKYDKENRFPAPLVYEYGMRNRDTNLDNNVMWNKILRNDISFKNEVYDEGMIIWNYQQLKYKEYVKFKSFSAKFKGLRCLAVNNNWEGSLLFDSLWDESKYDIMLSFDFQCNAKSKSNFEVSCSLYTTNKNIDVSQIVEEFNGGGHEQAAGFSIKINKDFVSELGLEDIKPIEV